MEDDYSGYRKVVGIYPEKEEEFKELVRRVGVRRTMLECFPDIKEPIETVIPVDLNPIQRKMYQEIQDELWTLDQAGTPLHSPNILSMLNRLRQIAVATPEVVGEHYDPIAERRVLEIKLREPSSKLDATMEIIEGLEWDKERKDQVVVFSAFRDPLDLLKARLTKRNIPYLHLDASMNDKTRYELWRDEWPKKEHQVFLCTLAVGSESINLAAANRAIFLDQSWSPAQNKQAIGRIYRPGQTGVAQLIYIRAEDTVDFRILDAVTEKHSWFNAIFGVKTETDEDEDTSG
jgi:SNF2 family DNA or RNA helicase